MVKYKWSGINWSVSGVKVGYSQHLLDHSPTGVSVVKITTNPFAILGPSGGRHHVYLSLN